MRSRSKYGGVGWAGAGVAWRLGVCVVFEASRAVWRRQALLSGQADCINKQRLHVRLLLDENACSLLPDDVSWDEADSYCAAAGAWLCTEAELLADELRGDGVSCSLGDSDFWSSTPCGSSSTNYKQAPSSSTGSLGASTLCAEVDSTEGAHAAKARRCADASSSQYTSTSSVCKTTPGGSFSAAAGNALYETCGAGFARARGQWRARSAHRE